MSRPICPLGWLLLDVHKLFKRLALKHTLDLSAPCYGHTHTHIQTASTYTASQALFEAANQNVAAFVECIRVSVCDISVGYTSEVPESSVAALLSAQKCYHTAAPHPLSLLCVHHLPNKKSQITMQSCEHFTFSCVCLCVVQMDDGL